MLRRCVTTASTHEYMPCYIPQVANIIIGWRRDDGLSMVVYFGVLLLLYRDGIIPASSSCYSTLLHLRDYVLHDTIPLSGIIVCSGLDAGVAIIPIMLMDH